MEALVDFTCNLVILVSLVYFGVGFVLSMIEHWNRIDPAAYKAKAKTALPPVPLSLPESTEIAIELEQPEMETLESMAYEYE
ncbi:hypothetical protein [Thermocoleostomius sinensis]|uniref:Uncharacterized protein n=1 Tax=Thermocoleostomius sinensis A174 TaxID=2016057 RepID=A0A9E8ZE65_9CYAN|nr:hypothetical protein [Thermocoleostomius sinensis]WAL61498.1 hypothetical protein OXH18_05780 [Thermocoleostomius sinensis A174]